MWRLVGGRYAWLVIGAAAIGLAACGSIQASCFGLQTEPFGRPDTGTPRAGYCGPIDHWYRWVLFPIASVVLVLVLSRLAGRLPYSRALSLAALVALAVANYLVVSSLGYFSAV